MDDTASGNMPAFRTKILAEILAEQRDPREINGVIVPEDIRQQLLEAGISPNTLTQGELQQVIAAAADGRIIDDPNGVNLQDKLSLTTSESAAIDTPDDSSPDSDDVDNSDTTSKFASKHKSCKCAHAKPTSFRQMILDERLAATEAAVSGVQSSSLPAFSN